MYHLFYRSRWLKTQKSFFSEVDIKHLPDKAMLYEIGTGSWYRLSKTSRTERWRRIPSSLVSNNLQLQALILPT